MLRVAAVPYLNAKPITALLAGRRDITYSEHIPSRLAEMLAAGELDCALVSSIEAQRLPGSTILDAPCIASDGAVDSVLLFGRVDPAAARTVALDGASRTSCVLARIAYSRFLGRDDVDFRAVGPAPDPRATDCDATLVIGDAALRENVRRELRTLDLGATWTLNTGLPFVWAVWLAAPGIDQKKQRELEALLNAARLDRAACERIAADYAARLDIADAIARRYLSETIRYELGRRERDGLARFFTLAAEIE
jgi:chorismate dehydratase